MKTKFSLTIFAVIPLAILCQAQQKGCTIQGFIFTDFRKAKRDSII